MTRRAKRQMRHMPRGARPARLAAAELHDLAELDAEVAEFDVRRLPARTDFTAQLSEESA